MEYQDKAAGKIIGNVNIKYNSSVYYGYYPTNMEIEAKDGKVRMILNARGLALTGDVMGNVYSASPRTIYDNEISDMKAEQVAFRNSYVAYMKSSSTKQDW